MKTRSIWEGTAKDTVQFSSCAGEHTADVVIIGGGITGLTAAYLLSKAGKTVVVLEAHKIGLGTTGNSTGNLYVTVDEHLSHIKKLWNKDVMKAVVKARGQALAFIDQLVKSENIDCDYAPQSFHYYAESLDTEIEKFIDDEAEALYEANLEVKILEDVGLPFKTIKGLKVSGQAQFHPLKYARGLAGILKDKCSIFEDSKVVEIDDNEGIVTTANAVIRADKIIMATHTPIGVYSIQSVLAPYREFGVAAELQDDNFPGGIFWALNQPKHSIRTFHDRDNDKKYAIVVGDKFKTGHHGDSAEHIKGLESYLRDRMAISEPRFIWGGQHYRPADGLAYIGKHSDRLYFLTGYATDGLIYGTLASLIVSDQILGKENPWESTFKASRFTPLKSAKDFITENVDNVVQYLKDLPWNVNADALDEVQKGEGKVLNINSEKFGVYRDEADKCHIVSAVCSHMKCIVNWNASEKSWDCPCHGSRFNFDGEVIEGPAIRSLKKWGT
jgi:glycine/D-amino acid oxidase-like deaminating enzyme/nitrite reductase/ring-hydroxylating ferredoxin subunit